MMEKLKPTADCIVARLVSSWGSRVSLLFKATEPYEHYYDENWDEVPCEAIVSWTDVELPPESEDEKIKKTAIKILRGVAHRVFEHEGVSKESVLAYLEKQEEQPASGSSEKPNNHAEWNGADEGMLNCIIATLCEEAHGGRETNDKMVTWLDNRLRLLRPQPHWKPTKAMLDALNWARTEFHPDCADTMDNLTYLYKELEQLYYDGN